MKVALVAAAVFLEIAPQPLAAQAGTYEIPLAPTATAASARGHAKLHFAPSPFGVAVTADGRNSYDVAITLSGLPSPASLHRAAIVAWAVSPDLSEWQWLGPVGDSTTTLGPIDMNKFLLVVTAEPSPNPVTHSGPILLRGYSPSIWLQSFITHPLFRGVN